MTRKLWVLLACVVCLAGCDKCGSRSGAQDAGASSTPTTIAPGKLAAMDLRSATFLVFPEFRGATVTGGHAKVTRTFDYEGDAVSAMKAQMQKGFEHVREENGALFAERPPLYRLELRKDGSRVTAVSWLPMDDSTVKRVIDSPSPIGTENISMALPKLAGAKNVEETFEYELTYVTKEERAAFLVRQLADLMLGSYQWKTPKALPPKDAGELPEQVEVHLLNESTGGKVDVERKGGTVTVRYTQPLYVPK